MKYLFEDRNQGYYSTYTPFECNKELTQKTADELTMKHYPGAGRTGSNLETLGNILCDYGYEITPYKCTYRLNKNAIPDSLDPLPSDFKDWPIIEGICGNY